MKISFTIIDPNLKHFQYERWEHEFPAVPRIGEQVIRFADDQSSLDNRFVVQQVYYIAETRDWYLARPEMCTPIVVELVRKER